MPEGDRYVIDGSLLRCDKSPLLTPLTVPPRASLVNGRYQANVLDCIPVVNIKPFGVCALTHGPCMPVMPFWTQAHPAGRTIGLGPAAPLLESSVCQCGLGGRISITVLPVPGMPAPGSGGAGLLAAGRELGAQAAAHQQAIDDEAHAESAILKEEAAKVAMIGFGLALAGLAFPPLEIAASVFLTASEGLLVAAVAEDTLVALEHPTQDNWATVGGDVVAIGTGYALGRVVAGPVVRGVRALLGRELGAEASAVLPKTQQAAQQAMQRAGGAADDELASEAGVQQGAAQRTAIEATEKTVVKERNYYKSAKGEVTRNYLKSHEYEQAIEVVELKGGKFEGQKTPDLAGIDGHLDGKPVSLKEYTGNSPVGVLRHVSKSESQIKNANIQGADIYVNAKNVSTETIINYSQAGPLKDIPAQGTISNIYIQGSDGWVEINSNTLAKLK